MQPAFFKCLGVGRELVVLAAAGHSGVGGISSQHAGFDGGVATLDAGEVQKARIAANQRAAGEHCFRQAHQTAAGDGTGAIADALAAFQVLANGRVGFPALHFFKRAQPWVAVFEPGDKAQRHLVAFEVVQKAAAISGAVHGPAK